MTSSPSSLSTHLWAYSPCSSSLPSSTSLYVALSPLRPSPEGTSSRFLTITRIVRARGSRLGADLVECTSGQSEDYPSHWGVYILNTVFVLLWSNGPCECAAWSVRVDC